MKHALSSGDTSRTEFECRPLKTRLIHRKQRGWRVCLLTPGPSECRASPFEITWCRYIYSKQKRVSGFKHKKESNRNTNLIEIGLGVGFATNMNFDRFSLK